MSPAVVAPAILLVLSVWRFSRRHLLCLLLGAVAAVCVLTCSGCGTTSVAGVAIAAKPILDTTCAGARMACRLIDSACSAYEDATAPLSEDTSGGEAP